MTRPGPGSGRRPPKDQIGSVADQWIIKTTRPVSDVSVVTLMRAESPSGARVLLNLEDSGGVIGKKPCRRSGLIATSLVIGIYAALAVLANLNAWTTGATRALQQPYQDP